MNSLSSCIINALLSFPESWGEREALEWMAIVFLYNQCFSFLPLSHGERESQSKRKYKGKLQVCIVVCYMWKVSWRWQVHITSWSPKKPAALPNWTPLLSGTVTVVSILCTQSKTIHVAPPPEPTNKNFFWTAHNKWPLPNCISMRVGPPSNNSLIKYANKLDKHFKYFICD